MKILLIILTIFLTSCKLNKIVNHHGIHNLEIKSKELLKELADKKGTKKDLERIIAIGSLIETTDFLNISLNQKKLIKKNMIWCNSKYEKYTNEN